MKEDWVRRVTAWLCRAVCERSRGSSEVVIIGVDCSVQKDQTGYARAVANREENTCTLECVNTGTDCEVFRKPLGEWFKNEDRPLLLALDVPLGWPLCFRVGIGRHTAGFPLSGFDLRAPDDFFLRQTDHDIKGRTAITRNPKNPKSVAADWIARTAAGTLDLLARIRKEAQEHLPLAWNPEEAGRNGSRSMIEVYPAATLALTLEKKLPHSYRDSKGKDRSEIRGQLARGLVSGLPKEPKDPYSVRGPRLKALPTKAQGHLDKMKETEHALDSVICVLAAWHFLQHKAKGPCEGQRSLARQEGWIWAFNPTKPECSDSGTSEVR
ncbi:MAG: DUF429 domain-containing protein [Gammaproteobacteria bacterium]|nr:DUF429 domain-containing protein [Gammaproteobacteria bacterium]